jgi:hypothetical protein
MSISKDSALDGINILSTKPFVRKKMTENIAKIKNTLMRVFSSKKYLLFNAKKIASEN